MLMIMILQCTYKSIVLGTVLEERQSNGYVTILRLQGCCAAAYILSLY